MSVGISLAMGLVQGFQNNIAKEEARRLADDQKIDKMEEMLLQAQLTGGKDYNSSAGNKVGELITSARTESKNKKPIDIWGTQTDGIDVDLSKVQGIMNNVADVGYSVGGVNFNTEWKGDANTSRMLLGEMAAFANESDLEDRLDSMSDRQFMLFFNAMGSSRSAILAAAKKNTNEDMYTIPDIMGKVDSDNYAGLYLIDEYKQARFGAAPLVMDGSPIGDKDRIIIDAVAKKHQEKNNGQMPESVGASIVAPNGEIGNTVLSGYTDPQKAVLATLAQNLGVRPLDLLYYWQRDFMILPDVTPEDQQDALEGAVAFGTTYRNPQTLDPDVTQGLYTLDQSGLDNAYNKLVAAAGTDFEQQLFALVGFMSPPEQGIDADKEWGQVKKIKIETIQKYVLRKIFGDDKADGADFKTFVDNQKELDGTVVDLEALDAEFSALIAKEGTSDEESTPLGYVAMKAKLKAIFDPSSGAFGGLIRDVVGLVSVNNDGVLDLEDDENLTTEYSDELEKRVERARVRGAEKGQGEQYAQLEAMRISLAFRMARAADPSGRLSNQDIEQQLRKLGTDWQTMSQAKAAVGVAIREFKNKAAQYKVLSQYANSSRSATARDYMIVDAAIAVDHVRRNSNIRANPPGKGASSKSSSGQADDPPTFSLTFTDDEGEVMPAFQLGKDGLVRHMQGNNIDMPVDNDTLELWKTNVDPDTLKEWEDRQK